MNHERQNPHRSFLLPLPLLTAIILLFLILPTTLSGASRDVDEILVQAEVLIKLGVVELGAGRSFEEAGELLSQSREMLGSSALSASERIEYERQIQAVEDDLDIVMELYEERFYGVFPLSRLAVPSVLDDEGLSITEQLFHPPEIAATLKVTQKASKQLVEYNHPHVVIRSFPPNRTLENVAAEVLMRSKTSTVHTRRQLVAVLDDSSLRAYDEGHLEADLILRLSEHLNATNLMVLSLSGSSNLTNGAVVSIKGELFTPGETVQGSPIDASPVIRLETFSFAGYARDRRAQFWPILFAEFGLLLISLIWASRVRWNQKKPLHLGGRLFVGGLLFLYGRAFMIIVIMLMRRSIPEETALISAAWWWPAVVGMLGIILVGFVAWVGQARLTDIMAGSRGARAVGTIFGITALGAASYFVTPLLLLDEVAGFGNLIPFLISVLTLSLTFGYAARSGPPVPHYFMVFPFLVSFLAGTALFMASRELLWGVAVLSLAIALIAFLRHRLAVAGGWEEQESTEEEAAFRDQERLKKLREKIKSH